MQYRLRTLLIVLAILPPILAPLGAWGWREYQAYREWQRWTEMVLPTIDRSDFMKSMLCPSHPPDSNRSVPPNSN
jgi:hypothetical protein